MTVESAPIKIFFFNTFTLKCICCDKIVTREEATEVDRKFERLPDDKYDFLMANLGLRAITAADKRYFHDHDVNVCMTCFNAALKLF